MNSPTPAGVAARGQEQATKRIVVVDDDYAIRLSCRQTLAKSGYEVTTFEDGASGLKGVAEIKPQLVVVDLKMAGISGFEVIERVHQIDPNIVVIVITGYATIGTAVDAMKTGAYDFLPKPFKPDELRIIVGRGLERRRLLLEARRAEMDRELMKRRFITFVSHQLKTPLVAIHQYLDVMSRLEDTGKQIEDHKKWLARCLERTQEMRAIIDDWLTLAKIEGGLLARRSDEIELKAIVDAVLKGYEGLAGEHGVSLQLDMPDDEYVVVGDRTCFGVLFDNLIGNAIKYNRPGGSVRVRACRTPGDLTISVEDTGIGVVERDLPFLFDEFFRCRGGDEMRMTGTGLGLAICKRIVTEMGGGIDVESQVRVGSTFRVHLPAGVKPREDKHGEGSGREVTGDRASGR